MKEHVGEERSDDVAPEVAPAELEIHESAEEIKEVN